MKITAHDLKELEVIDDIIPEFGGADEDALSSIGNYMKGNRNKDQTHCHDRDYYITGSTGGKKCSRGCRH